MSILLAEHCPDPEQIGVEQASIPPISLLVIRPLPRRKHIERRHFRLDGSGYRVWIREIV
jgi:hypothetical protein